MFIKSQKTKHLSIGVFLITIVALMLLLPMTALAQDEMHFSGADLSALWVIPFVCMLLSIALGPLLAPYFWEHHFGKISLFWGLAFIIPCAIYFGVGMASYLAWHALILEYIPFIILLFSLFTIAGGIRLKGSLVGTPLINTAILIIGTLLASIMGTTGAAMLLIRPLIRANAHRKHRTHTVIFFIFLVANIGGCLTPLGDPPLFLGFLKGVSFFWTLKHLWPLFLILSIILLVAFFLIDSFLYKKEGSPIPPKTDSKEKFGLEGKVNFILLVGVLVSVFLSGSIKSGSFNIYYVDLPFTSAGRDVALLILAALSLKLTSKENREKNSFSWAPIAEVAKLFLGIFLSMIPAITILQSGENGALASVVNLVTENNQPVNHMYFWVTGLLSSFLDNAPTYVVFFNTAGGDAVQLMGEYAGTLLAISAGAVFMGANTYIGNAPNFMVRSIAENQGVKMPSFFGYMVWSFCILIPCFIILTLLFFL